MRAGAERPAPIAAPVTPVDVDAAIAPSRCRRRARGAPRGAPPVAAAARTSAPPSWAAEGQEVDAVQTGEITKVSREATGALAGNGIRLGQADGAFWFYGHLSGLAPGTTVGAHVSAGQLVGWVGATGNAGVSHVHRGLHSGGGASANSYPVFVAGGGPC